MKQRCRYIDYGKAIGILLIIFAHTTQYFPATKGICYYVCSFHVPIFFLLGGCLASYRKELQSSMSVFVDKRAKTLLIPYVVFSLFNSALKFAVLLLKQDLSGDVVQSELIQLFITGNGTVWFCITYFFVEILFQLIKKVKNDVFCVLSAIVSGILPFLFEWNAFPITIVFVRILAGLSIYIVGYYIARGRVDIQKFPAWINFFTGGLCMCFGALIYSFLGNGYAFFEGTFRSPWSSIPNMILGGVGVILIANGLAKVKLFKVIEKALTYLGKNSLAIMLIHPTVLLVFTYPLRKYMLNSSGILSAMASICLFIVVVLLEIPCIYAIERFFPWMIGRSKKSR